MKANAVCLVGALAIGAALGFGFGRMGTPKTVTAERDDGYVAKGKIADQGADASAAALRARIAELEKALAAKPTEIVVTNVVAGAGNGERRFNPQQRLEEMKKNDPERYVQTTNRIAQWRQRRVERARSRLEFLASVDTSRMSGKAKKVHDELQDAIARQAELEERLHDPDLTEEDRKATFGEMHDLRGRLADLNRRERTELLNETASELGLQGEDAKCLTDTIREVIEATDSGFGHGPGGHGRHGGPGRHGGRGGAGAPPARGPGGF